MLLMYGTYFTGVIYIQLMEHNAFPDNAEDETINKIS